MKLESLKSGKFKELNMNEMNQVKGGYMTSTNSRDVKTGEAVPDRQEVIEIKNINGVVTGYQMGCIEYQFNGVWYSGVAH